MEGKRLQHKRQIHKVCSAIIEAKLRVVDDRLLSIRESRDNETKSSVGDKYETGRAMMQIEEENAKLQQSKILEDFKLLNSIRIRETPSRVEEGSVVRTHTLHFYISIALGKIECDGSQYYCISKNSPIGQKMYGKRKGDTIAFNRQEYKILEVW